MEYAFLLTPFLTLSFPSSVPFYPHLSSFLALPYSLNENFTLQNSALKNSPQKNKKEQTSIEKSKVKLTLLIVPTVIILCCRVITVGTPKVIEILLFLSKIHSLGMFFALLF